MAGKRREKNLQKRINNVEGRTGGIDNNLN